MEQEKLQRKRTIKKEECYEKQEEMQAKNAKEVDHQPRTLKVLGEAPKA